MFGGKTKRNFNIQIRPKFYNATKKNLIGKLKLNYYILLFF